EHDVVADLYVARDVARDGSADGPDEVEAQLHALLDAGDWPRPVRRVVVAIAGGPHERMEYYTYRRTAGRLQEEKVYRGLHPMMSRRLQLWRLKNFEMERLPSDDDVYLFRVVARDNPQDERLIALAEVRDLTAVRGPSGELVAIPHLEHMLSLTLEGLRAHQADRPVWKRLHWNRVHLFVRPALTLPAEEINALVRRLARQTAGLGIERVLVYAQLPSPTATGALEHEVIDLSNPGGGLLVRYRPIPDEPLRPLSAYEQRVVQLRRRGLIYPYELLASLTPKPEDASAEFPPGEFVEYDLDQAGQLVRVARPPGGNTANVVVGLIRNVSNKHPEGVARVAILGDPSKSMGSLAEAECRRIMGALDLAERMKLPVEWFAVSAGAKISMESGTENMDWIAAVLRRLVEFTQAGGEVNVVVCGVNVGAQPYWNAEATMLMHTRGILVMLQGSSMVLTGKQALDYSGGVSAEDNEGIGGYERIMGPNGQAQYAARNIAQACRILLDHYDHTYIAPGERAPRRAATSDPIDRDVRDYPHGRGPGIDFATVGDVFSEATNPGRKHPFEIRKVMKATVDQDHAPLERWMGMRDAETAVVWDAHIGGYPVCLLGLESHPIRRLGFVPADGPTSWTSGTLFPASSKKVARAINAASSNRPVVVLANLSGFDGSPESMRRTQLEFGAEIGRAVVNFRGPMVFCVISRYHGGAFVVFSNKLNDNLEVAALEGTHASVIGGAPAAAVVFAREVERRTREDPRVVELGRKLAGAAGRDRIELDERLAVLRRTVHAERMREVAEEFDEIHSVQRAKRVGSVQTIIPAARLRPYLVDAIARGLAKVGAATP
ncbi:MAG: carbamoyl-phosphate synthase subunit L, partial [Myxococcales bacterium]|nr:carbamoyl-phosphate synthase subunit L [Myxococcales bacterium]